MRSLTTISILAVFALVASASDLEWKRHLGVEEEFNSSNYVFAGEVVKAREVLDADGFIQGTFYTVQVEELLKGSPQKQVEIYDENDSGRFPMKVGAGYILFAYESAFENVEGSRLTINSSGNSAELKQARKVLQTVRKLKAAKAQPDGAANGSQPVRSENKSNVIGDWPQSLTFSLGILGTP